MTDPAPSTERPTHVIRASHSFLGPLQLRLAWKQRELAYLFSIRDLKLRYKQTALGFSWSLLQPLLTTGVLSVFFGRFAKLDSQGIPYPLFCLAGLLPWTCFAGALGRGSVSLSSNAHLVTKIYFPRILIPISSMIPPFVDFAVGLGILLVASVIYGHPPGWHWLWEIPTLVALLATAALGLALILGSLNVRFRDVSNVLPFLIQMGLFVTPVIYSTQVVPESLRFLYSLNPMVAVVGSFRATLLRQPWDWAVMGEAVAVCGVFLAVGLLTFARTERHFADAV